MATWKERLAVGGIGGTVGGSAFAGLSYYLTGEVNPIALTVAFTGTAAYGASAADEFLDDFFPNRHEPQNDDLNDKPSSTLE